MGDTGRGSENHRTWSSCWKSEKKNAKRLDNVIHSVFSGEDFNINKQNEILLILNPQLRSGPSQIQTLISQNNSSLCKYIYFYNQLLSNLNKVLECNGTSLFRLVKVYCTGGSLYRLVQATVIQIFHLYFSVRVQDYTLVTSYLCLGGSECDEVYLTTTGLR